MSLPTVTLGRTGLTITKLVMGTAPLASVFWGNDAATAGAAADEALAAGITAFDTAPLYGLGEAEERLGAALARAGQPPVAVATKVGRLLTGAGDERDVHFDFSADAVHRSLEASLARLGRGSVDVVHVHDPDDHIAAALDGALPALVELRRQGVIRAVSVGANSAATVLAIAERADLDVAMVAGRCTLLDQSATDALLPHCAERGIPVLAAAVFNSGILARPVDGAWFDYAPAPVSTRRRVEAVAAVCARHGVPLPVAALRFPLTLPGVAAVVVGMASAAEVRADVDALTAPIPDDLWAELAATRA